MKDADSKLKGGDREKPEVISSGNDTLMNVATLLKGTNDGFKDGCANLVISLKK